MRRSLLAAAISAAVFAGVLSMPALDAQTPPPNPLPVFEVAAVKQNKSGDGFIRFGMLPGGRFTAENVPLRELLRFAFQIQPFQIEGAPSWAGSDRFDITAKAEGDIPPTQPGTVGPIQYMMRSLLADRFGLVYHDETKEMPMYHLMVAREGALGPKLTKSTTDCAALFAARRGGGPGRGPGGPPPPMPAFGEKMVCGFRVGPGTLSGGSIPLSQLANFLSQNLGRTVLDKTGLDGNYDFDVAYTPDQIPAPPPGAAPNGAPAFPPVDPNGPSLTTALQEQLGLRLDGTRGPVTMFVIDKVSQPTSD
jgi:uncharacterized protein (TIGR03435 family)